MPGYWPVPGHYHVMLCLNLAGNFKIAGNYRIQKYKIALKVHSLMSSVAKI